jgi:hypothetical protein
LPERQKSGRENSIEKSPKEWQCMRKNRKARQDMETRRPENAQVASVIVEFKDRGCRDDVLKLAKEDLELGYPKELVALYAEAGWQMERSRKFSSIMRANSDGDLLQLLAGGGFNPYQMQLLANYYDKGVTVAQLSEVGSKNLTAYDMEQALKLVHQANREAEAVREKENPETEISQEEAAAIMEALRQREKELEEQQEISNKQASENAKLRAKVDNLEQQVKELEQEKEEYNSEKRSILEERDRFYQQNQMLLEEKNQLLAELEAGRKGEDEMGQALQGTGLNSSGDSNNCDFRIAVRGRNGQKDFVSMEKNARRRPEGIRVFAEKIFGRGGQDSGMIKQLTGKGLNPAQMEQVRMAVQAGLTGQEVKDLIDSGFSAEEMAQAVEIVLAEKAYQ